MAVRFASIEQFALGLPGVVAAPHFHFASWRVTDKPGRPGRLFVTIPPGEAVLHVFLPAALREQIFIRHPDCTEKLFWGEKVCGVRVLLEHAATADVKAWVKAAWAHQGGLRLQQRASKASATSASPVTAVTKPKAVRKPEGSDRPASAHRPRRPRARRPQGS